MFSKRALDLNVWSWRLEALQKSDFLNEHKPPEAYLNFLWTSILTWLNETCPREYKEKTSCTDCCTLVHGARWLNACNKNLIQLATSWNSVWHRAEKCAVLFPLLLIRAGAGQLWWPTRFFFFVQCERGITQTIQQNMDHLLNLQLSDLKYLQQVFTFAMQKANTLQAAADAYRCTLTASHQFLFIEGGINLWISTDSLCVVQPWQYGLTVAYRLYQKQIKHDTECDKRLYRPKKSSPGLTLSESWNALWLGQQASSGATQQPAAVFF